MMRLSIANSIFLLLSLSYAHIECFAAADESESESESQTKTCNANNNPDNSSCSNDVNSIDNGSDSIYNYNPTCKFYLAPSSIPNAGFGIYTTEDIAASALLTEVPDAPSIVVTDTEVHTSEKTNTVENHGDYYWDGTSAGEFEAVSVSESVMTFGSLCNYHTYLHNIKPHDSIYDDAMTSRGSGSPGVGAYSYHSGYQFMATRDIRAGEELFANYGEEWLDGRGSSAGMNKVPRKNDFDEAGKILSTTIDGLKETNELNDAVLTTIKRVVRHLNRRASSVLPDTVYGLEQLLAGTAAADDDEEEGENDVNDSASASDSDEIAKKIAEKTLLPRTMNWIRREGICMDNLVPQVSTLPHAGRGAFAQRFISKGEIVVPAPLLQIMDYSSLFMYDIDMDENGDLYKVPQEIVDESDGDGDGDDDDDDDDEDNDPVPSSFQMIYNYCFSHEETSMLLCPQTNSILINHCSTRQSYGGDCERYNNHEDPSQRGPNAEMRWATGGWDPDTEEWLDLSLKEIQDNVKRGKRGLSLEIVATRDIKPGEEVFIDYGKGWEDDWEEHVRNFQPYSAKNYVPVKEMNQLEKLRTAEELEDNPYPSNVRTVCAYYHEVGEVFEEDDENEYEIDADEDWIGDGSNYTSDNPDYQEYGWLWDCHVLMREDEEKNTYIVEILTKEGVETAWSTNGKSRRLTNYPRESISFVNEMYQSDQHLLGVFRSYIRIPDDIFPENWKDLEAEDNDEDEDEDDDE